MWGTGLGLERTKKESSKGFHKRHEEEKDYVTPNTWVGEVTFTAVRIVNGEKYRIVKV